MDFEVVDSNSFNEYVEANNSETIRNKIDTSDVLVVPAKHTDGEYYFAQESVDFIKFCRLNDKEHQFDILSEDEIKKRTLHSFDIWMGVIYVSQYVLLPIATGLVSAYIYEKMKGHEDEDTEVDVTFEVKHKKKEKKIHFRGSAEDFNKVFREGDLDRWFK